MFSVGSVIPQILGQVDPGIDVAGGSSSGDGLSTGILLGVVLSLVLFGLVTLVMKRRNAAPTNAADAPIPGMLNRDTRRRIDQAIAQGKHEEAGDLFSRAERHNDAAEQYKRAASWLKAARSYHASQNRAQAIHCYKQAGEYTQAARLYAEDGEHRAAGAEYVQANAYEDAAEQYAKAGDDRRAAENFERAGLHLKSAKAYERAQDAEMAAQQYDVYLQAQLARHQQDASQLSPHDRDLAKRIGTLYQEQGQVDLASQAFQVGGFFEEAAECLRTTGDYSRAAEMLIHANQPLLAAKYLDEAGEAQRAAEMRAEELLRQGDKQGAANAFRDAGELEQAAKLFEQLEQHTDAAELYEELEQYAEATDLFVKGSKFAQAARCAEAAEQLARAAELYDEAGDFDGHLRMLRRQGDFFRAGRLLFEHRQFEEALKVLEIIDSRDPLYVRSLELQGDVLRSQGRQEKAYSRYRAALGTQEIDRSTIPLFYKMARALEEVQDFSGAVQNYTMVVEVDPQYEDASLRLNALRERLSRQNKKTTSSGLFSSKDIMSDGDQRYEIIEEIARGGMGIVYQARDTVLGRVVAYKILGENLRDNETAVKYFLREARAAAALSHPNIVTIFDAGEQDNEYYMAMEYVEGTTLKELVKRAGALPDEQVRYIAINSCRALQYAHSKGVIHRDIKSGNVMITRDKTLKVMDFGLAKFLKEYQNNHTQQVGTPFYMSPEQIIGKHIDFRSDLYSLGCMLFECATGTVPFFKGDLSYHHLHTKPPAPRSINPALHARLEAVILKLLEKQPDDRYQSASEVVSALS